MSRNINLPELTKEIISLNEARIEKGLDALYAFTFSGIAISNPLLDLSGRFEVESPSDTYGEAYSQWVSELGIYSVGNAVFSEEVSEALYLKSCNTKDVSLAEMYFDALFIGFALSGMSMSREEIVTLSNEDIKMAKSFIDYPSIVSELNYEKEVSHG